MEQVSSTDVDGRLSVENVGGIEETTVTFSPGVTLLVGRNATNRTSFLQALMAALGSEDVAIKGDAETATVELTLGGATYTRELRRQGAGDTVAVDGDPYLEDSELADLFAFLLESNEARRAVATGADLRELIMRPVDVDDIRAQIDRLVEERESLELELEEIADLKGELPGLEEKRSRLRNRIEEKRETLEAKEAELEAADADVAETRADKSELEDRLETLRSKRAALDDVRYDLETERESLVALRQERRELEAEYEGLPEAPAGERLEVETELERHRERQQRLEAEVNELQNVIGFNEELLANGDGDAGAGTFATLAPDTEGPVTDQLLDDEVVCWTCGSEVAEEQIEATLGQLRELSRSKVSDIDDIEDHIEELRSTKRELERAQRDRERIERRLDDLTAEIERTEATIERLQERRDELTGEIETVEAAVEKLEAENFGAVLDLHREANQLEYELGSLETDLDRVEDTIAEHEARIAEEADIQARLEELEEDIESLRTKIDRIEVGAVEQFNGHMDTVLELLEYANLDRIWIERREQEVQEGRRTVTERIFDLHVVRTTESGTAYEDTVEHLSESEREVTGLVFALAGYLVHEVYEQLPFVLLDSLEAIDADRIAALVDYLAEYTGYLFVALLPEDAAALSDAYDRITEI